VLYLVRRKYPTHGYPSMSIRYTGPGPDPAKVAERAKQAEAFEAELLQMSPVELEALVAEAKREDAELARKKAEAEEKQRFYNQPMPPDYDHYCKCATWTLEEAIALSFGAEPEKISSKLIAPYAKLGGAFPRKYMQRWVQAQRAKAAGQLWDPVLPGIFLAWAKNLGIELPTELLSNAVNRGISLTNWQNLYEQAIEARKKRDEEFSATIEKWRTALETVRSQNAKLLEDQKASTPPTELPDGESLTTATRNSMLKLIIGMAIMGYRYDPRLDRNSATGDIRGDLEKLGLGLKNETIGKYLKIGTKLLSKDALAFAQSKPKSTRRKPKSI
jgi:hypothetical protein